jgi:hypothetical protein
MSDTSSFTTGGGSSGGSYNLVQKQVASSSANISFVNLSSVNSSYDIFIDNLVLSTNASLKVRFSTNNGVSYDSGNNYGWGFIDQPFIGSASVSGTGGTNVSFIQLFINENAPSSSPAFFNIKLFSPDSGYSALTYTGLAFTTYYFTFSGSGFYTMANVNALQFYVDTGVITSGNFYLNSITG